MRAAARMDSICASDYDEALRMVARAGDWVLPVCLARCVLDQPPPEILLELPDLSRVPVVPCLGDSFAIPPGAAACWAYRDTSTSTLRGPDSYLGCQNRKPIELVLRRADLGTPAGFLLPPSLDCGD